MKKLSKRLAVMIMAMVMVLGMAIPANAAMKRYTSGAGGYSVPDIMYCTYVHTGCLKKTVQLKQTKGVLNYKKANGKMTTLKSYAKFNVKIRENDKYGKVVKSCTWNDGSLKFKLKANRCYFVEVTYVKPVSGEVLIGPLYRQNGWKKNAHWDAKAVLF